MAEISHRKSMVDCLRDQQDPTGSSPGFQTHQWDQLVPQTNQSWIPLIYHADVVGGLGNRG